MDLWKKKVVYFVKLKAKGIEFEPSVYDFIYIGQKRSVGLITEILDNNIYAISFFKSLNSNDSFSEVIKINREKDVVIPSYENLLKVGHQFTKTISNNYKTGEFEILTEENRDPNRNKFKLYGKLETLFKATGDVNDYDNLLNMIIKLMKESKSTGYS